MKVEERLYNVTEVALIVNSSINSINNWYRFKKQNPDNEYAKILPDFIQKGQRRTRYWKQSDIDKLLEFKSKLPKGRNGILGSVTQKWNKNSRLYYRKDVSYEN